MKANKNLNYILPVIVAILFIIILGVLYSYSLEKKAITVPEQIATVSTTKVIVSQHTPEVTLYGQVEPSDLINLEAAIDADVLKAPLEDGSFVKKGQIIVELDDREAKINYQQRLADVKDLEAQIESEKIRYKFNQAALKYQKDLVKIQTREMQRLKILVKQQAGSESALDKAIMQLHGENLKLTERSLTVDNFKHRLAQLEAKLKKANALFDQAKLDLERTIVKAPADGRLTKVPVAIGNRVQKGETIAKMFSFSSLEVKAQIPIPYLAIVKAALTAKNNLTAHTTVDKKDIKLQLKRLSGELATGQGGVDAYFKILSRETFLSKGRILELQLQLPAMKNIVAIPPQALYDNEIIYAVNKQLRLNAINVKLLGQTTNKNGKTLILVRAPDLKTGMEIITTQLPNARTGLKVQIVNGK